MGRNIIFEKKMSAVAKEGEPSANEKPDNYASQIVKLIPVEVVGVYLGISNLIAGQNIIDPSLTIIQSIVFVVILIITPFYLWRVAAITDKIHIIIATISFVIWAISLGGPFESILKDHLPPGLTIKFLGGIVIMIYTLIVPIFYKTASKDPV